jgi:hypothetical protein
MLCLVFLISCSQSDLWKELTKNPDLTPPVVSSVSPNDGETGVAVSGMSIKVQFSEQMNSSSVNEDTFYITDSFGSKIECVVSDFSSSITFKASPVSDLSLNSTYTVFISKNVSDMAGNKMKEDYTFSFTTAATAPTADNISPEISVKTGGSLLKSEQTISSSSVIIVEIKEKELVSWDFSTGNSVLLDGKYTPEKITDTDNDKLIITITPNPSLNIGNNLIFRVTASDLTGNVSTVSIKINVTAAVLNKVYVNSSTGDDENIGTDAYPVKRVSVAINRLNKSDECFIYLTSGTYKDSVAVSGFNNGITISGGWSNNFSSVNQYNSKSIVIGENSGISISNCSKVKLSGISVITNVDSYSVGSVYSNITVSETDSFEINCCDLQGINTGESEYKDSVAMSIDSATNVKIISSKIRTNYERIKPYSSSGKFKGVYIRNSLSGSEVYIFNTQIVTGNSDYASGTSVHCLYVDGSSSGDIVCVANNTFDLRGGDTMQCVYFENSAGGDYIYDFNVALGRYSSDFQYVVYLSNPGFSFESFDCDFCISTFTKFSNVTPYSAPGGTTVVGDNYESTLATNYTGFDYLPTGLAGGISVSNGFTNYFSTKFYKDLFPKNSSNEYVDINGTVRPSSGSWYLGAYHRN